jgi:hypothetical protein
MSLVPPPTDPRWSQVLLEDKVFDFEFLATNMIFTRLTIEAKRNTSKQNLLRVGHELWEVFNKNAHNPKVLNDIRKIFG